MARPGKRVARIPGPPLRYNALLNGDISVEDLDDEEIFRMQLRNKNGSFAGAPPMSIPREIAMLFQQEQQKRFQNALAKRALPAVATLDSVMAGYGGPTAAAQVNAAKYIIDRFAGKTPDVVFQTVKDERTFEDVLDGVLVDVDEEDDEF